MPIIDDGHSVYSIGPDGKKQYASTTELKVGSDYVYRFDAATHTLFVSPSPEDAVVIGQAVDKDGTIILPGPLGEQLHFHEVQRVESLPPRSADGKWYLGLDKT